jgi:hypothetical protein
LSVIKSRFAVDAGKLGRAVIALRRRFRGKLDLLAAVFSVILPMRSIIICLRSEDSGPEGNRLDRRIEDDLLRCPGKPYCPLALFQHEFTVNYFVDRLEVELAGIGGAWSPARMARSML